MNLKPFFDTLYNVAPKIIYPTTVEDLRYKIAIIIQSYFGEFRNGSLYLGVEDPVTPDELADLISMQESDTNDYLNSIKVLGISTYSKYDDNHCIKVREKWTDYLLDSLLEEFFTKKISSACFQFNIVSDPVLFMYEVSVHLTYPKEEDGSILLSFSVNEVPLVYDSVIYRNPDSFWVRGVTTMSNVEALKKYTGYYACDDGSMDAEVVINKFNLSWNRANVLKYIIRAGKKDPNKEIEDLEKARNYINYEIEKLKERKECL